MMFLYEQIKNGPKLDHGICFVSPSAISPSEHKSKRKHIDDASRVVADRLSTRKDNDIIILPYNPGAMALYAIQSVNWVNAKCPYQTGGTECGYYVLKFMKEVVEEGIEILANDNVGEGKEVYTDEDIDEIREGCSSYGATFVFK
ncbi:putative papain-like cysteine peptidase superfamily [Helianthus debilis subsp. tardiflorus]